MGPVAPSRWLAGYVAATVAAAGGVAWAAAGIALPAAPNAGATAFFVFVLVVMADALQVRIGYRGHVESLNLVEAAVAPALWLVDPRLAPALIAGAMVVSSTLRGNAPIKAVFNSAQWALAVAAGELVLAAARTGSTMNAKNVVALAVALLSVSLVNQVAMAGVLRLATGEAPVDADTLTARGIGILTGLAYGVVLAAAAATSAWVLTAALFPQILLHWASRGYASARAEQVRLRGLQFVTHALSAELDPRLAMDTFLRKVVQAYECAAAELTVWEDAPAGVVLRQYRATAAGCEQFELSAEDPAVAPALQALTIEFATRVYAHEDGELAAAVHAAGWNDALIRPLPGNSCVGVLAVYDRDGVQGFESGEVAVFDALAGELASALERAQLVDSLLAERHKLEEIVGSTSDGILTLAPDGTIESWNTGMEQLTGYRARQMVGTPHFGQLRPRDEAGVDVLVERWSTTPGGLPPQMQILTADGAQRWLSCSYSPVSGGDGVPRRLVVVARNVTQVRELDALKDDFVAVVSHELRTPLSSIKGWASTLLTRGDRLTAEQRGDGLQAISRQAHRLEQLILNILEASAIEGAVAAGGSTAVDVSHVVGRVAEEVRAIYPGRAVTVSGVDSPALALGHEVWVERAVSNLVFNALKYSPDPLPVEVTVSWVGTEVAVRVCDHGPGIPPEARARAFERFERLGERGAQGGTGLGLYITRKLTAAMGGTVVLDETPGGGSTFSIHLPAAALRIPTQDQRSSAVSGR